jgi:hypothetical protein
MPDATTSASQSATSMLDEEGRALAARIERFIGGSSADDFDTLAVECHRYQYGRNAPYRRFVDRTAHAEVRDWREIPAVPAFAFRDATLACGPAARVYESSGTTEGPTRRARHHVPDPSLYRTAALAGFARTVLPAAARRRFVIAAPERASHPASSLGEMVSWIREVHDLGSAPSFLSPSGLDGEGLAAALARLDPGEPVVVLAVTSALLRLADWSEAGGGPLPLPAGSLIVDTGGCKGYGRDVPRPRVIARYVATLGVPAAAVVNEYGMTELCSQLYARGHAPWIAPPWMRTLVCDPRTGREVPAGEPGLLRHVDLANLGSVVAVQTEDVGRSVDGGIDLLGRARGAETRGCSLLISDDRA